ncbi:MAG: CRISPR-associated primase-polymerase type A1, partial [bacterium]
NQDLNHFLKLFAGREGVYSRQWLNNQGKTGYTPIHHPLDASKLKEHFNGRETLGYYLMRADNTVLQTVIDLDITRQARADIARSGDLSEWRRLLQVDADKICQILRELEIPYLIEDSGFKGLHIWIFWAAPILARDVNQFARALLGKAGPPPPGLHREVFPRETRVAPEALGSMVKLPLGIHKLTGRRCLFLDSTGEPFADQFAALRTFQPVTPDQFMAALDKLKAPELPVIEEENLDFTPIEKILQGCNVVRHLKEKAEKTKWLNHIERLTILSVFGHFGKVGEHTIHKIIGQTTNYSYRITQKWLGRLRPYPISCPKIREWHSHVTPVLGCPCDFPNVPNSYPSPVLHADPEFIVKVKTKEKQKRSQEPASKPQILEKKKSETQLTPSIKAQQGVPVEKQPPPRVDLNINELFQNYLKIKGQERELTQKLVEIEQKFHQICEQNNTDQLETEIGTLKRIKVGSEFRWVVDL